jgi:hypothetical protein
MANNVVKYNKKLEEIGFEDCYGIHGIYWPSVIVVIFCS